MMCVTYPCSTGISGAMRFGRALSVTTAPENGPRCSGKLAAFEPEKRLRGLSPPRPPAAAPPPPVGRPPRHTATGTVVRCQRLPCSCREFHAPFRFFRSNAGFFRSNRVFSRPIRTREVIETIQCLFRCNGVPRQWQTLAESGTAALEVQLRQADVRGDCQRQPSTASGRSPDRRLVPGKSHRHGASALA